MNESNPKQQKIEPPSYCNFIHGTDCVFNEIFENIDVGILIIDSLAKLVVFKNPAAENSLKDLVDSRRDSDICSFFIPDSRRWRESEETVVTGSSKQKNKIFGYTLYKITDTLSWVFLRDITEKMRLESIAAAVNYMENIGFIFSCFRHEIGNPLNSIKMTMSVLERNLQSFSPEAIQEYITRTLKEIGRVEYILKSLKNFNMFEEPIIERMNLQTFLSEFKSLITDDFNQSGIQIKLVTADDVMWVAADYRALHQVMLNLATNAADALTDTVNPEITIRTERSAGFVQLEIQDNGHGIPEDQVEQLFTPFYTTKHRGTGLGLVITKKLLAKMNCSISITSRENEGTNATIYLPEHSGNGGKG